MGESHETPALLRDILDQPASLAEVVEYQYGAGRGELEKAAGVIREAGGPVVVSGMGGSLSPCFGIFYHLWSRGQAAVVVETAELLHYFEGPAAPVVVLVSRSGDTVEVARVIPRLKERGAIIVGVTNEAGGLLAREAHHVVFLHSRRDEAVAIQTYTGTLATLLLLGAAATGEPMDAWRRDLDGLVKALSAAAPEWAEESLGWRPFLEPALPIYLLGRGPSTGSAMEGAMMFNEVAKRPSVAMSAGNFRHGPVEVAGPTFHAILFASQGRTRALELALAGDLMAIGGQVRVLLPGEAPGGLECWRLPQVPDALAPLVEIVPIHLAACRLAQWRGVPLGVFRYIRQVTGDEERLEAPARA